MARILVAEDDADIRDLVEFKLSGMGHEITTVGDGSAALDACRRSTFDLAILDMMMPVMSGLDATRAVRADDTLANLRVMLLTGRADVSDMTLGLDAGADDFVTKPFSPRALGERVEALLARPA